MKLITRAEAQVGSPTDREHFTGSASARALHRTEQPHPVSVSLVRFEAGTRNRWHRHGGGQLLHVVAGEGWAQSRGEPPLRLRGGDSLSTAPGEEHWHGAGPEGPMAHIAVSIGDMEWLEPSPEPPAADLPSARTGGDKV